MPHTHRTHQSGWMRAGVLGANDGILSIAGLLLGIAAAHGGRPALMVAGVAGVVAGALSMGAGEYVSVSSQADTERADLELERNALQTDFDLERDELRDIYVRRGLDPVLAAQVAHQLMAHDALGAHARDEIGITDALAARPLQAALTSTISFAIGGIVPMLPVVFAPDRAIVATVAAISLASLAALGALAARVGGAPVLRGSWRVLLWGAGTMAATMGIGALFGASV